jgi:PTH1 family peptidyl-tRNA hydrolase
VWSPQGWQPNPWKKKQQKRKQEKKLKLKVAKAKKKRNKGQTSILLKYLIAGLGNVGPEYHDTRHNVGFKILDAMASASGITFQDKRYGFIAEYRYRGHVLFLLKPSTFVNRSGLSVSHWIRKKGVEQENLLVVVDDIALRLGTVRMRPGGGDGGHNGLRNMIEVLGTQDFARIRFGIGNDFSFGSQVDYVLGRWTCEEEKTVNEKIPLCLDMIRDFAASGLEYTMNTYNKR